MTSEDDRLLPEQRARVRIDAMLKAAGWAVLSRNAQAVEFIPEAANE